MDERPAKRPGPIAWLAARTWRFWLIVALLPPLYVASWGPACWISSEETMSLAVGTWHDQRWYITKPPVIYYPLGQAALRSKRVREWLIWYGRLGAPNTSIFIRRNWSGTDCYWL